jgi:hypothetical protein
MLQKMSDSASESNSREAAEEPEGILRCLDRLEHIVDNLLPR